MILTDFPSDTILEICYYLPPLSLIRFARTCKKLWNLRHKLFKEHNVKDYSYCGSRKLWYQGVITAISHKDLEGLEFFLKKYSSTVNSFGHNVLFHAGKTGRRDIVDMVISYGDCKLWSYGHTIWSNGIQGAVRGGHTHLVEYFLQKDPSLDKLDTWNKALPGAACAGNIDMATYCIDKGATAFEYAFNQSVGALNMMKFLYPQIVQTDISVTLNACLRSACVRLDTEMIEYLVELGASDWNAGLVASVGEGNMKKRLELIEYFIAEGANYWNGALKAAIDSRNAELMELFIKKGADCLDECIAAAEEEAKNLGPSDIPSYGFGYEELCNFQQQYHAKKRKTE